MVMPTTDHIILAAGCKAESKIGIMMTPYTQTIRLDIHGDSMVGDTFKYGAAARGDQVLVAGIIPVNQMDISTKSVYVGKHERRDQITAMEQ